MVAREHPDRADETLGVRDVLAQMNQRIDDLRSDVNARIRLLAWGIAIGFAAVLAVLGALLAQGG